MEFIIVETEVFLLDPETLAAVERHGKVSKHSYPADPAGTQKLLSAAEEQILIAPSELATDPDLIPAIQKFEASGRVYWVDPTDAKMPGFSFDDLKLPRLFEAIAHSHSAKRTLGIKNFLEKGSVIYGEALFNAGNLGSRLDPAFDFSRKLMSSAFALRTWATLEAVILTAFQYLRGNGDGSSGDRVDVQVGADARTYAMSVRFDGPEEGIGKILGESSLRTAMEQCHLLEVRHLTAAGKMEVNLVFFLDSSPKTCIRSFVTTGSNAVEAADDVSEYVFKPLSAAANADGAEPVRKVKGFKKKFSEQVKTFAADKPEKESETRIRGDESDGFAASLVSGKAEAGKPADVALLESKLESAQNTIRQREELIQKLNKEIEEIRDPLKMGVITNIQDSQKQALADNIKRLETELQEADKREKELMSIADKAVQLRDEAIKKSKDLEGKLRMTSGGTNSKVAQLEKQLEESMRQRSLLSKRVDELTQKLGGKAA
ncbi:MAG: hypothetical protein HUU37_00355 [Bdellovibrionales bacterium]|nr:hypothetical protein [Bdellovibrionales bacterium]